MAKRKTNGKGKTTKLETVDIGCLPPPCEKLTPKRAHQWLHEDFAMWQAVVEVGTQSPDRQNGSFLAASIRDMVGACTHVIKSDRAVRLQSDYFGLSSKGVMPPWSDLDTPLGIVQMLLSADVDIEQFCDVRPALLHLVEETLKVVNDASDEEMRRNRKRRVEAREREDPNRRMEEIEKEREALKAERDAIIDAVGAPWERKIEALKYREDLIGHETWGYRHPGKPPAGYSEISPGSSGAASPGRLAGHR